MKKILPLLFAALMLCSLAAAEPQAIDLSAMTFEELVELSRQVQLAIFESDGWQEVTVPMGIYEIGADIPAGRWTISSANFAFLHNAAALDEYNAPDYSASIITTFLGGDGQTVTLDLAEGTFLQVDSSPVIFTPYVSNTLGFR